ncbi:MAG: ABC transporter ATP-binding protein [Actinomycetaceae bacterium]|nr:ABC transporter ATP-binding protein [Actinomycetaceae bacterium]
MIARETDTIAGGNTGVVPQAVIYVFIGLIEGLIYLLILPFIRSFIEGDMGGAMRQALIAGVALLAYALAYYWADSRGYLIGVKKVLGSIQRRLGKHFASLPLGWFTKERSGQMGNLMTRDIMMIMNLPSMFLRQYIHSFVTPLVIGGIFLWIDWRLGLAFFVLAPALVFAWRWSARTAGQGHAEEEKTGHELAGRFIEFAQAQPSLRAAGRTGVQWNGIAEAVKADYVATRRTLSMSTRPITAQTVLVQSVYILILIVSAFLLADKTATHFGAPEFVFVALLALRAVDALNMVGQQGMALRVSQNAIDLVSDVLREDTLPEVSPSDALTPADSSISFDNVSFSYDGTRQVLSDVSFDIPQGSFTALVGPSGSGKTTLTRLIARFWDVNSGAVRIGGVDVRDMQTSELMRNIALVFQDVYLFDGTIEENIRIGNPEASNEEVREAASLARLDEVAERLEDGWNTPVGEGGKRLSGGERQRVAIARAFVKNAPIVLFDEATAALDAENEAAIVEAMHELAKDRTVIAIAHRLSTIAGANQIVVLNGGKVSQRGTHSELIATPGVYANFWGEREAATGWHINA